MADFQIDDTVDITDVVCPVTFVKAKVALEMCIRDSLKTERTSLSSLAQR